MGQDLAEGERLYSVASEHVYALTDALNLIVETGWARGDGFRGSIWGQHMINQAGNAWQGALSLRLHILESKVSIFCVPSKISLIPPHARLIQACTLPAPVLTRLSVRL